MRYFRLRLICLFPLVVSTLIATTASADLVGVDSNEDQILSINTVNSSAIGIGNSGQLANDGFPFVEGLAYNPHANLLYGVNVSGNDDQLVAINPITGQATGIGGSGQLFSDGFGFIQGLAFDPNSNTLFGSDTASGRFLTIDTTTGTGTAFGDFGAFSNVAGLAFDPNTDTLYGVDTTLDQILTINTGTGVATGIGSFGQLASDGFGAVRGLTFDPLSNTLYGVDNLFGHDQIMSIDTVTGSATAIGAAGQLDADGFSNVDGLAFTFTATTAVPEPSSLLALTSALGWIAIRRRKR